MYQSLSKPINIKLISIFLLLLYVFILPQSSKIFLGIALLTLLAIIISDKKTLPLSFCSVICYFILNVILSILFLPKYVHISTGYSSGVVDVVKQTSRYAVYIIVAIMLYEVITRKISSTYYFKIEKWILNISFVFLLMYLSGYILQLIDYGVFTSLRNIFFQVDVSLENIDALERAGYFSRYSFIFLDPNNCGYCILAVSLFLYEKSNNVKISVLGLLNAFTVPIFTGSRGCVVALLVYLCALLFNKRKKKLNIIIGIISVIALVFMVSMLLGDSFLLNLIGDNRAFTGSALEDSRLDIWENIFRIKGVPPIFGAGYTIVYNGNYVRPHSDWVRIVYGYGLLIIPLFMGYIKKDKHFLKQTCFIPIIVGMTFNSVIDEPRFLYICFILLAYCVMRGKQSNSLED